MPRHSKSSDAGTRDNNAADSAKVEDNPLQPGFEQEDGQASPKEQAADEESEDDNYMPLSEDEGEPRRRRIYHARGSRRTGALQAPAYSHSKKPEEKATPASS